VAEHTEITWARDTAAALIRPLGRRWAHTLGVVERARSFSDVLPVTELDVLVAAAYLHDMGYAPSLARTGLHALDGACFLRSVGRERLACLVAHHSGARAEAEERGLSEALNEFPEERSLVADVLTYCDLATTPDGARTAPAARLSDVVARYGDDHPVGRSAVRSRDELLDRVRPFLGGREAPLSLDDALADELQLDEPA
jgi:HD domain